MASTVDPSTGTACAAVLSIRLKDSTDSYKCYTDAGYSFSSIAPANANDLPFICKSAACEAVVDLMRSVAPTECVIQSTTSVYYLYQDILNPIVRRCANLPSPSTATNASHTGEAPLTAKWTVTPATTTHTPSASSAVDTSGVYSVQWWLIVLGGVFQLVVIILVYKRCKRRWQHPQQENPYPVAAYANVASTPSHPTDYARVQEDTAPKPATPLAKPKKPVSSTKSTKNASTQPSQNPTSTTTTDLTKLPLLRNEAIVAVRVPFVKISSGKLLNRGGFGEVYKGTYKGDAVAIKQLLPEHRSDPNCINSFLEEAKLMFEHERIVTFVGVAWDKVSDMCVLTEYMEGGDLRSLLARYEAENRPEGFDRTKIQIALHVAHALTYMHSLQPIVLHRDLKSSNILLSQDLNAKVTDFGISRTLAGATMTRGVGTSLWMAPEIMMGGRYDEKADMFSFGVVLSELDSNKLPYASHMGPKTRVGDLMQRVAQGRLMVDFSYESDPDIVGLGRDCVALDPLDRPTAAEALHRIHQVLRQYQQFTVTTVRL